MPQGLEDIELQHFRTLKLCQLVILSANSLTNELGSEQV